MDSLSAFKAKFNQKEKSENFEEYEKEISSSHFLESNILFIALDPSENVIGYGRVLKYDFDVNGSLYGSSKLPAGWYLRGLFLDNLYRGVGLSSLLTQRRISWIKEKGGNSVFCFINNSNKASIKFHEKFGFIGIEKLPYEDEVGTLFKYDFLKK